MVKLLLLGTMFLTQSHRSPEIYYRYARMLQGLGMQDVDGGQPVSATHVRLGVLVTVRLEREIPLSPSHLCMRPFRAENVFQYCL